MLKNDLEQLARDLGLTIETYEAAPQEIQDVSVGKASGCLVPYTRHIYLDPQISGLKYCTTLCHEISHWIFLLGLSSIKVQSIPETWKQEVVAETSTGAVFRLLNIDFDREWNNSYIEHFAIEEGKVDDPKDVSFQVYWELGLAIGKSIANRIKEMRSQQ